MDYDRMEASLQVLFEETLPLSKAQISRIRELCMGVFLAGSSRLSRIARWMKQSSQQDSRIQWLSRTLATAYVKQDFAYLPCLKRALAHHQAQRLHVLMDRTSLGDGKSDLLSLKLNFRKRAIPIVWEFMPTGMSDFERQRALLERSRLVLPEHLPIVFHGDNEFGAVPMMQYLAYQGWDFILGQSAKNYYRLSPTASWRRFSSLRVSKKQSVYLSQIEITKAHGYGPLNAFAFYQPRFGKRERKRNIGYYVTSLPISPHLRRFGHRRWGIECSFKDLKSAGWNFQLSHLSHEKRREGLLTVLNLAYLWATCVGRWLCKSGKRHLVDAKSHRHLSLFRLGWDWLVYRYNMDLPCPTLLTLYQ